SSRATHSAADRVREACFGLPTTTAVRSASDNVDSFGRGEQRGRTGQAEVVTQGGSGVLGAEQAPVLQDRHDLLGEGLEQLRVQRRHHVEAVGGPVEEPLGDDVGDVGRRARDDMVTSRAGEAMEQLAQRRTLALDKPDETIWLHTSALSTVCHFSGGESPNTRCATRSIRYPERAPTKTSWRRSSIVTSARAARR